MATDNATAAGNDAIFSLEQMRGAYEHRALWLHYLAEKAVEDGENGPLHQAIRKCGLYHADVRFAPFTSMDDFDEVFQSEPAKSVFEMETIEKDDEHCRSTSITARSLRRGRNSAFRRTRFPRCATSRWTATAASSRDSAA